MRALYPKADCNVRRLHATVTSIMFTVAIIGRPNVGKSTLFNRVLGRRQAIVKDFPGVTRDRHYVECEYRGRRFQLVDTGGLVPSTDEQMFRLIREQSRRAIADADALIFLMDGREGLTPMDREIASLLRGVKKPVFVAVNKIDTPKSDPLISDFYELGWEPLYPLSAEHGAGVAELLDALYPLLPAATEGAATEDIPKVAVVGRPNVGKSTFINTLLGEPRLVVCEVPGTTRDADRKSTRLNSSHGYISYAVFCLKKKKNKRTMQTVVEL